MSRLEIPGPDKGQLVVEELYKDLERRIDQSRNLEEVRQKYQRAKNSLANAQSKKGEAGGKITSYNREIESCRNQLALLEKQDAQNKPLSMPKLFI